MCTAAGFHSYVDSPFGKPRRIVHFSSVQCVGNESRITDCPTTNFTYEQGKLIAGHLPVAGVACQQRYCECPLSTVELTTVMSEYPASTCPSGTTEYQVKTVTVTQKLRLLFQLGLLISVQLNNLSTAYCYFYNS